MYLSVSQQDKYIVEEMIRSKWNTDGLKGSVSTWCRRRNCYLCFLTDTGNDVTSFEKQEKNLIFRNWKEIKEKKKPEEWEKRRAITVF